MLVCTDAAAEGLNFQFCGALVNFDCPWNPMKVEQRIGRVDRLGQRFNRIAIVNLMYEGTVETDVYRALRTRINLFTAVVGRLQPILSSMPKLIAGVALTAADGRQQARDNLIAHLQHEADAPPVDTFDIDDAIDAGLELQERSGPAYGLEELGQLLDRPTLLPPGCEANRATSKDVFWSQPGATKVAVTTDPEFFEEHADSLEFWTPGSPAFPVAPEDRIEPSTDQSVGELLHAQALRPSGAAGAPSPSRKP